jgi:fucose permease
MDNSESSPLLNEHTSPNNTVHHVQTRAFSKTNKTLTLRIAAAMLSFSTLGLFNSSIGAVLPSISHHYALTDLHVSLLFLASPIGYIFTAQVSGAIHYHFGQRGIALIAPTSSPYIPGSDGS